LYLVCIQFVNGLLQPVRGFLGKSVGQHMAHELPDLIAPSVFEQLILASSH
jgi:hypothetical protein